MKIHISGTSLPQFEANMNQIPPSPSSSMTHCNKSATVTFHMELYTFYCYNPDAISKWCETFSVKVLFFSLMSELPNPLPQKMTIFQRPRGE